MPQQQVGLIDLADLGTAPVHDHRHVSWRGMSRLCSLLSFLMTIRRDRQRTSLHRAESPAAGPAQAFRPHEPGTTVARPSGCFRKVWLPLVRATRKPARSRIRMSSLPLNRGRRVIWKFAEPRPVQVNRQQSLHSPGITQRLRAHVSSACRESSLACDSHEAREPSLRRSASSSRSITTVNFR